MYIIVVGASPEGCRFIDIATNQGHEVLLVEKDDQRAREVLKQHSLRVLQGDIADDNILKEAQVERANAVVAATSDDSQNLMAMVLAREHEVDTRVSLINQQSHCQMFKQLGVKVVNDPARIIAQQLFEHVL